MPEFRAPRIRMPKVTLPGRSGGTGARKATASKAKTKEVPKAGNGTKPAPTTAKTTAAKGKTPDANLQERMEGLQGWMAEIERKQGRITYFGIAGLLIAILAAGAALYFGLTAKSDSATKSNVDALSKRIDSLEAAATKNSRDTQEALNASVTQLQQSISAIQKQQSENAASISTLQSQAAAGALGKGAAGGLGAGLTPGATTPGTTTTTPKGK
jgi:uncharacterized protein HemX